VRSPNLSDSVMLSSESNSESVNRGERRIIGNVGLREGLDLGGKVRKIAEFLNNPPYVLADMEPSFSRQQHAYHPLWSLFRSCCVPSGPLGPPSPRAHKPCSPRSQARWLNLTPLQPLFRCAFLKESYFPGLLLRRRVPTGCSIQPLQEDHRVPQQPSLRARRHGTAQPNGVGWFMAV
jgi:hypothetical protein